MNQHKNLIVFSMVSIASMGYCAQDADARLTKSLEKASPMELYRTLEGAKIVAFSKENLIKDGVEAKDLKGWNDVTRIANGFVRAAVNEGKALQEYADYVNEFEKAATFFKKSVDLLHGKYASIIGSLKKGTAQFELERTFSPDELKEIKDISDASASYERKMFEINAKIFNQYLEGAVAPMFWIEKKGFYTKPGTFSQGGELKDANDILKNYKKIIKNYETEKDFKNFLQAQKIKDKKAADKFLDALQGIEYIMKAKLLAQATETETEAYKNRAHNIAMVKEIIAKIHDEYPNLISPMEFGQIAELKDRIPLIVFAQAGVLGEIFGQLKKDANYLYHVAKSNVVRK